METIDDVRARSRVKYLRAYSDGDLSANELFAGLLDRFSENRISEELEAAGPEVRERVKQFLTGHIPITFRPFVMGNRLSLRRRLGGSKSGGVNTANCF